jgi:hypothetical protein
MDTLTLDNICELIKNGNQSEFFYTLTIDYIKESDHKILSELKSMCNIKIIPIKYQVTYCIETYQYYYSDSELYAENKYLDIEQAPDDIETYERQEYKIVIHSLIQETLSDIDLSLISYDIHKVQEYEITICEECYNAIIKQLYILENNGYTIDYYIEGIKKINQEKFEAFVLNFQGNINGYLDYHGPEWIHMINEDHDTLNTINDISYKIKITPPI